MTDQTATPSPHAALAHPALPVQLPPELGYPLVAGAAAWLVQQGASLAYSYAHVSVAVQVQGIATAVVAAVLCYALSRLGTRVPGAPARVQADEAMIAAVVETVVPRVLSALPAEQKTTHVAQQVLHFQVAGHPATVESDTPPAPTAVAPESTATVSAKDADQQKVDGGAA